MAKKATSQEEAAQGERQRLVGVAYRMLGTVSEAEEAVQEAYLRWYRLDDAERAVVENIPGWLTRVVSRICLDVLRSARVRREQYVGPWLPEPVPGDAFPVPANSGTQYGASHDPLDRLVQAESVSTALLVVLESMTPAERVAFVLHEVFAVPFAQLAEVLGRSPEAVRQLASSARRRVRAQRRRPVDDVLHARVVTAFTQACQQGDIAALTRALHPEAVLRSDGGGVARAARNPVRGAEKVARYLLGVLAKNPEVRLVPRDSSVGLLFVRDAKVTAVLDLLVDDGRITQVWQQSNPAKLTCWTPLPRPRPA